MDDALARVLQLVADGRLTADEAAPILAALDAADPGQDPGQGQAHRPRGEDPGPRPAAAPSGGHAGGHAGTGTALRIEVRERDRQVVNLRLPLGLGRFALDRIPGMAPDQTERIREALRTGVRGPILEVDGDDGDGVRIVVE